MTVRLHIMRLCTPSIWPALARANKYSKSRNREARRDEVSRVESNPVPPFPALWRAISKSYSQFLSGTAYRDVRSQASLFARFSRELIPDAGIANNRARRARCGLSRPVTPRVQQRDCTEQAIERASVSAFVWIAWEIIISISECALYVCYRQFLSLRVFHCFLQCVSFDH